MKKNKKYFFKIVTVIITLFFLVNVNSFVVSSAINNIRENGNIFIVNSKEDVINIDLNFTEYEIWDPNPPKCGKYLDLFFRVTDELKNLPYYDIEVVIVDSDIPDSLGLTWLVMYSPASGYANFHIFFEWGSEEIPYSFTIEASIYDSSGKFNDINPENNLKTFTNTGEKSKNLCVFHNILKSRLKINKYQIDKPNLEKSEVNNDLPNFAIYEENVNFEWDDDLFPGTITMFCNINITAENFTGKLVDVLFDSPFYSGVYTTAKEEGDYCLQTVIAEWPKDLSSCDITLIVDSWDNYEETDEDDNTCIIEDVEPKPRSRGFNIFLTMFQHFLKEYSHLSLLLKLLANKY